MVSEAQMRALFGEGMHPDRDAMLEAGSTRSATKLGAAYPKLDRVAAAVAVFEEGHDRTPSSRERNTIAAKEARRGRRAVAGFDLVFTPVKSASVLWGLGGAEVRQAVEDAHHEAVRSAIGWVEQHAAYTRTGLGNAEDGNYCMVIRRPGARRFGSNSSASSPQIPPSRAARRLVVLRCDVYFASEAYGSLQVEPNGVTSDRKCRRP